MKDEANQTVCICKQNMEQKASIFFDFQVLISLYYIIFRFRFVVIFISLVCCGWPHGVFDCIFYQNNSMEITQLHSMYHAHLPPCRPHIFCKMSSQKQQQPQLAILIKFKRQSVLNMFSKANSFRRKISHKRTVSFSFCVLFRLLAAEKPQSTSNIMFYEKTKCQWKCQVFSKRLFDKIQKSVISDFLSNTSANCLMWRI